MKKKKLLVTIFAAMMAASVAMMSFTACGNNPSSGDQTTGSESAGSGSTGEGNQSSGSQQSGSVTLTKVSAMSKIPTTASASATGDSNAHFASTTLATQASSDSYSQYRNEDFYIEVKFNNPNNYKIAKFTINYAGNDYTFTSRNFESGSSYSCVYVKVPATYNNTAYTEYTVSDVVYEKGSTKQTLDVQENNSVLVGVKDKRGDNFMQQSTFEYNDSTQSYSMNAISSEYVHNGVLEIPATYNGKPVTTIGTYAFIYEDIQEVVIPDSVTTIESFAFYNCKALTKVTIGTENSKLVFSGEKSFYGCDNISKVNYNGSIAGWMQIGFMHSVDIQDAYLFQDTCNTNARFSNPVYYARDLYINNELLTEVVVPSGITRVLQCTFMRCISLASVTLNDYVKTIGYRAFDNCTGLSGIDLKSVEVIDRYAFSGCWGLTSITIPATVTKINGVGKDDFAAFYAVQKLVEVYNLSNLPITAKQSGNGDIGYYADTVYNSVQTANITENSNGLLWYTKSDEADKIYLIGYQGTATEITIPNTYNNRQVVIKDCAFAGNNTIEKVTLADGFTAVPDRMFAYCRSLKSVVLPDTIESIGEKAFYYSTITSLTLPAACTFIGENAFNETVDLTLTIQSKTLTFGLQPFNKCKNLHIIYSGTYSEWTNLTEDFSNVASTTTYKGALYGVKTLTVTCQDSTYSD